MKDNEWGNEREKWPRTTSTSYANAMQNLSANLHTENVLLVNEKSDGRFMSREVRRIVEAISIFSLMLTHEGI